MEEKQELTILDGREFGDDDNFLSRYEWEGVDIAGDMLDQCEDWTAPRYTLSWDGVKFAPLGGLHVITGQSGSGKTFAFTQLIVAILRGSYGRLRYELDLPPTVLYIDTEMEKENTKLVNLRVYEMMGWQFRTRHDEFRIMCLRDTELALDRWRKILKAISVYRPTVCLIDGLLDIVTDFNDNAECQEMVYVNMKVASHYGMSLWVLVHENPNSTKMVGHLGSILQRKVSDELGCVKNKDEVSGTVDFTVRQKKARGKDMREWKFRVIDGLNNFGIPEQMDGGLMTDDVFAMKFKSILPVQTSLTATQLRKKIMGCFGCDEREAEILKLQAIDRRVILVTRDTRDRNVKHYTFNCDQELPF